MPSKKRKLWKKTVSILACLVVFCTTYALIMPAVTVEKQTYCHLQEHKHTDECFETKILAGHTEADEDLDSLDSDDISEDSDLEESADETAAEENQEQETVREKVCQLQEHQHTKLCYSNLEDVESEEDWLAELPEFNEEDQKDDAKRIVDVALSQVGYQENKENFILEKETVEDEYGEKTINEKEVYYSRYGELFGTPYLKDWSAQFIYFVLHYAIVDLPLSEDYFLQAEQKLNESAKAEEGQQEAEKPETAAFEEATEEETDDEDKEDKKDVKEDEKDLEAAEDKEDTQETESETAKTEEAEEEKQQEDRKEQQKNAEEKEKQSLVSAREKMLPKTQEELIDALHEYGDWKDDDQYQVGDLAFIRKDDDQVIGFVSDVSENKLGSAIVNTDGKVREVSFDGEDVRAFGYLPLSQRSSAQIKDEAPDQIENKKDNFEDEDDNASSDTDLEQPSPSENDPEQANPVQKDEETTLSTVTDEPTVYAVVTKQKMQARIKANTSEADLPEENGIQPLSDDLAPQLVEGTKINDYITSLTVSKDVNGQWQEDNEFTNGDRIKIHFDYKIDEGTSITNNTLIYDIPASVLISTSISSPIYEKGTNKQIGIVTVSPSGQAVLVFNEDFLASHKGFEGEVSFDAQISVDESSEDQKIDLGVKDTVITVKPGEKPEGYDLRTAKKCTSVRTNDNGKAEFTFEVEISSERGTEGPVSFKDIMKGSQLDPNSVVIKNISVKNQWNQPVVDFQYEEIEEKGEKGFKIDNLQKLGEGNSYKITYTVEADAASGTNGSFGLFNAAVSQSGNSQSPSSIYVSHNNPKIQKSGQLSSDQEWIEWTIKVTEGDDLEGAKLEDVLKKHISDITSDVILDGVAVEIKDKDGNVIDKNQKLPFTFTKDFLEKNKGNGPFQFTYKTKVDKDDLNRGDTVNYENKATLKENGKHYESTGKVGWTKADYGVAKSAGSHEHFTDYAIQKWTANISLPEGFDKEPGLLDNIRFTDELQDIKDSDGKIYENLHYYTFEQLQAIKIKSNDKELHTHFDYEIWIENEQGKWVPLDSSMTSLKFTKFQICFTKRDNLDAKGIYLEYESTVRFDGLVHGGIKDEDKKVYSVENKACIPEHETSAKVPYNLPRKLIKLASNEHNNISSTVGFKQNGTVVDFEKGKVYYMLIFHVEHEDLQQDTITIEDVLPDGLKCIHTNLKIYEYKTDTGHLQDPSNMSEEFRTVECNCQEPGADHQHLKFKIHIKSGQTHLQEDTMYAFVYEAEIDKDSDIWNDLSADKVQLTNHAKVGNHPADSTVEVDRKLDNLSKTGEQEFDENNNPTNCVTYHVTVNPTGKDLVPELDYLTLIDKLAPGSNSNASLIPDSVKVYAYDYSNKENFCKGEDLDPSLYSYTYQVEGSNPQLTVTVPDSLGLVVEYKYRIDVSSSSSIKELELSNSASLKGVYGSSAENKVKYENAHVTSTAGSGMILIRKVSSNDYSVSLPGATFKIESFDLSQPNGVWKDYDPDNIHTGGSYTTDENGNIQLNLSPDKDPDILFRITETSSPDGYSLTNKAYYVLHSNTQDTGWNLAVHCQAAFGNDASKAQNAGIIKAYQQSDLYIPNKPTQLKIEKHWADSNGNPIEPEIGYEALFQLYRQKIETPSVKVTVKWCSTGWNETTVFPTDEEKYKLGAEFTIKPNTPFRIILKKNINEGKNVSLKIGNGNRVNLKPDYKIQGDGRPDLNNINYFYYDIPNVEENIVLYFWDNGGGANLQNAGAFEANYAAPVEVPESADPVPVGDPFTLSEGNWSKVFTEEDLKKIAGGSVSDSENYTYTVKEIGSPNGYIPVYSVSNDHGLSLGILTVTNKKMPPILPETGGQGSNLYIVVGSLLIALSLLAVKRKYSLKKDG